MPDHDEPLRDREYWGRRVAEIRAAWAKEQAAPKLSWPAHWEKIPERTREMYRRIGETVAAEATPRLTALLRESRDRGDRLEVELHAVRTGRDRFLARWFGARAGRPERPEDVRGIPAEHVLALARDAGIPLLVVVDPGFQSEVERLEAEPEAQETP